MSESKFRSITTEAELLDAFGHPATEAEQEFLLRRMAFNFTHPYQPWVVRVDGSPFVPNEPLTDPCRFFPRQMPEDTESRSSQIRRLRILRRKSRENK